MIIVSEVPKAIYNTVFNNDNTENVVLLTGGSRGAFRAMTPQRPNVTRLAPKTTK